jgi:ParB family chromosome partitioning protein
MRHDSHYVEELSRSNRTIGKILPIEKIEPNPDQPRVEIGDLTDLASSIKEKGVLEPLLVKPVRETGTWMIIAGERRWRSAKLAGLKEVPVIELDIDEKSIAEIALIENLQRKDLTVWEEADGLAALATRYGYTHEQIAKKIGKSRSTITESMSIAGIPENIREKCLAANISAKSVLLEIARQFDERAMSEFVTEIGRRGLSRDEVRETIRPNSARPPKTSLTSQSRPKNASNRADSAANAETAGNFTYSAADQAFRLEIAFRDEFERKDILKALKEAFEFVKGQRD